MAGLALALDLLDAGGRAAFAASASSSFKALHSAGVLSAASVAAAAAAGVSLLPQQHLHAFQESLRGWGIAHCEAPIVPEGDWYTRWMPTQVSNERYIEKTYTIELKPLFSAFRPRALSTTTLRALLMNFLPLLEAYMKLDEDEEDDPDRATDPSLDVMVALKRSGYHALREVSVITVRRVLERIVVHYVSARTAWKLLKDAPKSAVRKARRNLSKIELFARVSKTALGAHALGVGANWLVQEVIDIYRSGRVIYLHRKNRNGVKGNKKEVDVLKSLGRRTTGNTLKAVSSLTFASIGAGCGAVLIRPSSGTWIGLAIGDFAGTFLVGFWLDTWIYRAPS